MSKNQIENFVTGMISTEGEAMQFFTNGLYTKSPINSSLFFLTVFSCPHVYIITPVITVFNNHANFAVLLNGRVENWMNHILREMRVTNRFITKKSIFEYGTDRERSRPDWICLYQGMVCLAASQVWWTAEVADVFRKIMKGNRRAMIEFLGQQNKQIDDLVVKGKIL